MLKIKDDLVADVAARRLMARGYIDHIKIDREQVADFCRQNCIRRLALFGSVLRDDFRPDSDVDVLVEFEPGARVGLIRLAGLEARLSAILGRQVDVRTPADLSRYFRQDILNMAEVLYERE